MKTYFILGISLLLTLIPLAGCGHSEAPHNNTPSGVQSDDDQSSTSKNNTDSHGDHSKSSSSEQSDKTSPNHTPSATQSSNNQAPTTTKEVINQVNAALSTQTPVFLPTHVPISKGNSLTAAAHSETWYYRVNFLKADQPSAINTLKPTGDNTIATVTGTEYDSAANAQSHIENYTKVKETNVDLGHGIKGESDAGAGHFYVMWNEGRWCLRIDSPNDPNYQMKQYSDAKGLAKDVVSYLEDHMLNPPKDIGVISISTWNNAPKTTIQWQNHKVNYEVTASDPFTALNVAVSMKAQ
ncbi:lipoprotein [Pullulanibacillus camelliae]|uniref:Lipoprotein n=1 Tax=Pullulanibacillus camelliae TaxID=1707096 RepID=A0A8J2YF79_9BACL|nr:hypothetical protein [Pullulanibacillus camelliae]GGE28226.1 lipoprotein [Pullulanibacillus camelliae]